MLCESSSVRGRCYTEGPKILQTQNWVSISHGIPTMLYSTMSPVITPSSRWATTPPYVLPLRESFTEKHDPEVAAPATLNAQLHLRSQHHPLVPYETFSHKCYSFRSKRHQHLSKRKPLFPLRPDQTPSSFIEFPWNIASTRREL